MQELPLPPCLILGTLKYIYMAPMIIQISHTIWQSFDNPTDTLLVDQSLPCKSQLTSSLSETDSSTGRFCLHKTNTTSSYNDKYYLKLNSKGSLQIWNSRNDSSPIATLPGAENDQQKTGGNQIIYRATLDFDGGFQLRVHHVNNGSDKIIASWPRENPCEVNGFCSFKFQQLLYTS
jgi:hypothetical protein